MCQNCDRCPLDGNNPYAKCVQVNKQPLHKAKSKSDIGQLFIDGILFKTGPFPLLQYLGKRFDKKRISIKYK